MRYTKLNWFIIMLALSLVLSACNLGQEPEPTPDVGAIFTAAAETVSAQFSLNLTQTALAAPPATPIPTFTSTPVPTFVVENPLAGTPAAVATLAIETQTQSAFASPFPTNTPLGVLATQAGPLCMDSIFIQDITYPDGTEIKKNKDIEKIWRVKNTGTCTWDDGFALVPVTGDAKGTWEITKTSQFVAPGEVADIGIYLQTPKKLGDWGGCWKMKGDGGYFFGTFLCISVKIID